MTPPISYTKLWSAHLLVPAQGPLLHRFHTAPPRHDALVNDASIALDSRSIQARCSVKPIHDIISRFDDRKRRLVESIGFGGLLKFPPIKSTNRRFSAWLMGMVDIKSSCLTLPDGTSLKFTSKDIGLVFGIPATGKNVSEAAQLDKMGKEKMKLQCWPLSGKDQHSIKAVEELVNTKYSGEMTPDQEDAFRVAFVVFVMSTLFVPGAKHDYVHVDYWGALSNPSSIHEFDWAAYVHKRLITSAGKYKTDVETASKAPNITGCYLFLQVMAHRLMHCNLF